MTMSAFGNRQMHYEYYFFGDPIRMGMTYFEGYEKESYKEIIKEFLGQVDSGKSSFLSV
jgi:4-hydroxyphenylacetate 3-monooxygenase